MIKNDTEKYVFKRYITEAEALKALNSNDKSYEGAVCASLTRGCIRCEAVFVIENNHLKIVFDILVKEKLTNSKWIYFDSILKDKSIDKLEAEMLKVIQNEADKYSLSYSKNSFERITGMKKNKKKEKANAKPYV